jgi:hypothetical protein
MSDVFFRQLAAWAHMFAEFFAGLGARPELAPVPCRQHHPPQAQRTITFLNCHGSDVSMSSGNRPGRSVNGVQSV